MAGGYTAKDYLGWDPVSEPPPDNVLDNPKVHTSALPPPLAAYLRLQPHTTAH